MKNRIGMGQKLAASFFLCSAALAAPAGPVAERTEIYSTFNNGRGAKYDLHQGWSIEAKGSFWNEQYLLGVPFVPETDVVLRKVQLPLWHFDGENAYFVSLRADEAGLPGAILERFDAIQGLTAGVCCAVVSVSTKGIPLSGGQTYWIVLKAKSDTAGGWVFNVWHNEGFVAINEPGSTGFHIKSGVIPAVRILGE